MLKAVQRFFFPAREESATYREELHQQSARILLPVSIVSIFAWLNYIPVDAELHPEQPLIFYFRIGLTAIAGVSFILTVLPITRRFSMWTFFALGGYLLIATGILTGLTGGDQAYLGGYLFILTVSIVGPIERVLIWSLLTVSIVCFFIFGFSNGMEFSTVRMRYSLNDLLSAYLFSMIAIYFLDRIRRQNWTKARELLEQKKALEQEKHRVERIVGESIPVVHLVSESSGVLRERSGNVKTAVGEQSAMFFNSRKDADELIALLRELKSETENQLRKFSSGRDLIETIRSALQRTALLGGAVGSDARKIKSLSDECYTRLEGSRDVIEKLRDESERIEEISQTINDIADQTSLLALNASIESARAGEHGRGFAVVADAVSRLSEKTVGSAREIGEIIARSVSGINSASRQVRESSTSLREIIGFLEKNLNYLSEFDTVTKAQDRDVGSVITYLEGSMDFTNSIDSMASRATTQMEGTQQLILKIEEFYSGLISMAGQFAQMSDSLSSHIDRLKSVMGGESAS